MFTANSLPGAAAVCAHDDVSRFRVVMVASLAAMLSLSLAACGGSTSTGTPPTATLAGRVTAGPTCPVERLDHPCPPAPVSATVQARSRKGGRVVASTRTDADGRYRLRLRAGAYTLVAVTTKPFPRCSPVNVTARANHTVRAAIVCDTGIR
jgi:hypothetical protein